MRKRDSLQTRQTPFHDSLPSRVFFRADELDPKSHFPSHRHSWGEFVYSFSGVMEVQFGNSSLLAPPHYGIWLPPDLEHIGLSRNIARFCSLYVDGCLCDSLPQAPCVLSVNPLARAILEHLRAEFRVELELFSAYTEEEERILLTLLDQLRRAEAAESYLTSSDDPALSTALSYLESHPEATCSNSELAVMANVSERTLTRRSREELGMSLNEWRQRLRTVRAISLLEGGQTVEAVALDLGYSSASAFIAMFRRQTGSTPGQFGQRQ